MKKFVAWRSFSSILRIFAFVTLLSSSAFALDLKLTLPKIIVTAGSGQSTITSLIPNADGTISIEAAQAGKLSQLGKFTGNFSYLATIDPNTGTTFIHGSGYLDTSKTDRLYVNLSTVEVGLNYPRPYVGGISITGGTGKYAGASGFLEMSGIDVEALTDSFQAAGVVTLR